MKKAITIPFLPQLENTPLENAGVVMEELATRQSIENVNWPKEFSYKPITSFSIAYSNNYIYILYFVRGNCLRAVNSTDNSPVWEDSCIEFFAQVPGEKEYYNFEFNCIGTALAAKRKSKTDALHFDSEKMSQIKRLPSMGNKPFNEMVGLFAWELLVAIPFELLGLDGNNLPKSINANFYKCADATSLPHYVSWSPIDLPTPNFHCPEFFGEVIFEKKEQA